MSLSINKGLHLNPTKKLFKVLSDLGAKVLLYERNDIGWLSCCTYAHHKGADFRKRLIELPEPIAFAEISKAINAEIRWSYDKKVVKMQLWESRSLLDQYGIYNNGICFAEVITLPYWQKRDYNEVPQGLHYTLYPNNIIKEEMFG